MEKNSIRVNYIYNLSFQVVAVFLPFITTPYISRVLGAGNIGVYSYTDSLTAFFLLFASLGVLSYGSREVARVRDDKTERSILFWDLIVFKFVAVVCSYIAFFMFFHIKESKYTLIYMILSLNFLTSFLDLSWFYRGMEMFKQLSLRNTIVKLLGALLMFVLVKNENDLPLYIICIVVPGLIGNILLWGKALKYVNKVPLRKINIVRHLKPILVFFIPAISVQIYHTVDKLMLQWILHDNFENGYYDQAYKIITILLTTVTAFNSVMYSRLSNLYKHEDFRAIDAYLEKSISVIEMISFPMAVGLFLIAPRFVPVFFGESYADVVILLRLFSPMIIITGLSNMIANQCLIPAGNQGKSNIAIVFGSVVNVVLNGILIPKFASVGACIATIVSETVILIFMCVFQKGIIKKLLTHVFNYLTASLVMGGTGLVCESLVPNNLSVKSNIVIMTIYVVLGMVIYFGFLLIRKDKTVVKFMSSMVKRN